MILKFSQLDPYYEIANVVNDLSQRKKTEKDKEKLTYIDFLLKESERLLQQAFTGDVSSEKLETFLGQYSALKEGKIPDLSLQEFPNADLDTVPEDDLYSYLSLVFEQLSRELQKPQKNINIKRDIDYLLGLLEPVVQQAADVVTFPYTGKVDEAALKKFNTEYAKFLNSEPIHKDIMKDFETFKQFLKDNVDELKSWTAFQGLIDEFVTPETTAPGVSYEYV